MYCMHGQYMLSLVVCFFDVYQASSPFDTINFVFLHDFFCRIQQEGKRQEESDADVEARQRMVSNTKIEQAIITTLCDWLKKTSRYLIDQSTRPNHTRLGHKCFPRLEPATCICFEFSLVHQVVLVGSD